MDNSRWIKIEIKRTAEIAPRHPLKTEICARSACVRRARVALTAFLARNHSRWIKIWRLTSGAARFWQPSRAERSRPTSGRRLSACGRRSLLCHVASCGWSDYVFRVLAREFEFLKDLIRWFRCSVFYSGFFKHFTVLLIILNFN